VSKRGRSTSPGPAGHSRRFTALAQRRSGAPHRYAALRRRESRDAAVIQAIRHKLAQAGYRPGSPIKRVNLEGPPVAVQPQQDPVSHAVTAAVAIAFVLPLFFAFVGGKMMPARNLADAGSHRFSHVAFAALGGRQASMMRERQSPRGGVMLANSHAASIALSRPARIPIAGLSSPLHTATTATRLTIQHPTEQENVTGRSSPGHTAARRERAVARPAGDDATRTTRARSLEQRVAVVLRSIFMPALPVARPPVIARAPTAGRVAPIVPVQRLPVFESRHIQPTHGLTGPEHPAPQATPEGSGVRLALAPPTETTRQPRVGPWTLSPDGTWRTEVEAPPGSRDVSFSTTAGELIKLEPSSVHPDAATLDLASARPVRVVMTWPGHSVVKLLPAPDDHPEAFSVAARALGPHLVRVGWTPLAAAVGVDSYRILRSDNEGGPPEIVATVAAGQHAWQDGTVAPGATYRYTVVAQAADDPLQASTGVISTPPALDTQPISSLRGKGMFLYFSTLPGDARSFRRYDPQDIVARARAAGIRVIELRMARGACMMAETPAARAWLNQTIDAAAQAGITLLAWTVPRRDNAEDIAQSVAAAAYRTPKGNGFAGLALDLETGSNYMGDGRTARQAMVAYVAAVRAALGPGYLLVAIVESPAMGHADADYPYAAIARYASVLQPMEYWHYFDRSVHHKYGREEVAGAAARAVSRLRALAGRDVTIDLAGQSVDLAGTGSPSGREIAWSLAGAKGAGAVGEVFFDWAGTRPDGWAAIQAFDW
jgi:hypothetical protein